MAGLLHAVRVVPVGWVSVCDLSRQGEGEALPSVRAGGYVVTPLHPTRTSKVIIVRAECPDCGAVHGEPCKRDYQAEPKHRPRVDRTYVAVDALLSDEAVEAGANVLLATASVAREIPGASDERKCILMRSGIEAAIREAEVQAIPTQRRDIA